MHYSRRRWALVLSAFLLIMTGCGNDGLDLSAQTWMLVEVDGAPAVPTGIATLSFADDGTLSGNTGCNSFTGSYEIDGSSLTIASPLASSLRACDEEIMSQETAVLQALESTSRFSISGSELELIDDSNKTLARYSAES